MPRAEMLARMSSAELTEWAAYEKLEPFPIQASYIGPAIVAATVANVNRKKGRKPYPPSDFLPNFGRKKKQSVDEMLQFASMMTVGLGGKDLREDKNE